MILVIFLLALIGIALWLFLKDHRFSRKDLKENLNLEMKKILNIPTSEDSFPEDLETRSKTKQPSQKILEDMNQDS